MTYTWCLQPRLLMEVVLCYKSIGWYWSAKSLQYEFWNIPKINIEISIIITDYNINQYRFEMVLSSLELQVTLHCFQKFNIAQNYMEVTRLEVFLMRDWVAPWYSSCDQ